jgi:choline monooxygenase
MKSPDFPEGERGAFSPEAHASPTLPSRYYHDAQIYLQEQRSIFHKNWCYVGHVSQFSAPGDYRVERVADQCIFLVSDQSSDIRAFFNVCQHRGHELLSGDGKRKKRIVCPYHAWSYGLDGKLIQAPHTDQLQDFDPAEFALKPVRLANCAGLLFANLDGNAGDFETEYPGLAQTLTDSLPGVESFGIAYQFDFDIAANWKIVVDNFSEGYHIPVAHRKLAQVLDSGSGSCARQEQRYAFFESRSKAGYEGLEIEPGSPYRSWTLWPNTCMLSLPGCANLVVIRMAGSGPDRCLEHVDLLAEQGAVSPALEALKQLFADQFNAEDIAIVESVHRGLKSLGYDQGRYVVDAADTWYSESGLHRFHRLILEALEHG